MNKLLGKYKPRVSLAILSLPFCLSLTSCLEYDQTVIRPEHTNVGNPEPAPRPFIKINKNHKVLLAIFDSGIDYNHPDLINNVHFELDEKGNPIGAGKDYMANDNWASWRVVDTNSYEFQYLSTEEKEDQLKQTTEKKYNTDLRRRIGERQCLLKEVIEIDPRLSQFTHPYRATIEEEQTTYRHGTHVAGLMTYDRPDFGLIPYRILPYHQNRQDKIDSNIGKADKFAENFADAISDADKKGVKIVNLSIGGSFLRPDDVSSPKDEAALEKFNNLTAIISKRLTEIIKTYPHILFVAAAGNDSGWSDNDSRIQYPCGVEADNVLCVGALNKRDSKATFTNVPLSDVDLVFAPGAKVNSLSPSDYCPFLNQLLDSFLTEKSGAPLCSYKEVEGPRAPDSEKIWTVNENVKRAKSVIIKAAYEACSYKDNQYIKFNGTSMATPLVSHLAAEILAEKNYAKASEVIEQIKLKAQVKKGKSFTAFWLTDSMLMPRSWDKKKDSQGPNTTPVLKLTSNQSLQNQTTSLHRQVYDYMSLDLNSYLNHPDLMPLKIIMGTQSTELQN